MSRKTYVNAINPVEVAIAIERLLIAPYPQTFTPAAIDLGALPAGFYDLGSVVEDTPSFKVSRDVYQLKTGVPMVVQFQSIMGMSGEFNVSLNSNSWRKVQFAFGNFTAVSSAVSVGSISSVNGPSVFTLVTTPNTPVLVGYQIVIAPTTGAFDNPDAIETRVVSITTNGLTFALMAPVPSSIGTGWQVGIYDHVTQAIGSRQIKYYTLLGIADFTDGVQIVHEMMKVSPKGDWEEAPRPGQNGRVPLHFEALGVETTINSCTELLIAQRHYFPTKTALCNL